MKDRQSGNKLGNIAELNCLGYCFVEFKTAEEAQYVLNRFNGKLIDDTKRYVLINRG